MRMFLPHPPKELRPNFKCHWAVKARAGKAHKYECYLLARVRKKDLPKTEDIHLDITFHPRTRHKIDRDNALSSMKWALDGLAEAWDVNDHRFIPVVHLGNPIKGGKVMVEVS